MQILRRREDVPILFKSGLRQLRRGEISMSESDRVGDDSSQQNALLVRSGHKLRPTAHTQTEYGSFATRWACKSCGMQSGSRFSFDENPCEQPILWVQLGCPKDGLRVCDDCGAVFVGEYGTEPFYERTCIECGSHNIRRDDDPNVSLDEVIVDV